MSHGSAASAYPTTHSMSGRIGACGAPVGSGPEGRYVGYGAAENRVSGLAADIQYLRMGGLSYGPTHRT